MAGSNVFTGAPIVVAVTGPTEVVAGQQFSYKVKVLDKDGNNPFNPSGVDPSVAVNFQINSMGQFGFQIAPNPDSAGNLVCVIIGQAQSVPGIYVDSFMGFNTVRGLTFDQPVVETHTVTVKAP